MGLIQVRNLYKSYDGKNVLRNLSFDVEQGERLCVLGENGCGKSTLLKLIAGWENPDSGGIFMNGKVVEGFGKKLVRGHKEIILLNQNYQLNNQLNVYDNVMMVLKNLDKSESKEIADDVIEWFRLGDFLEKKPLELSGGQRQRACLAQCMAQFPKVLLLDEPFSNQDHRQKELLQSDLKNISESWNTTLFFVTHDAVDALGFSTDTLILEKGKIIQRGSPITIYNQPADEYTALLTGDINILSPEEMKQLGFRGQVGYSYYIRPENIHFVLNEGLPAEITQVTYAGYFNKVKVKASGIELLIYHLDQSIPGTNVQIKLDVDKIGAWSSEKIN